MSDRRGMHVGSVHVYAFAEVSDRRGVYGGGVCVCMCASAEVSDRRDVQGGGVHVCAFGCSASELPSCI